MKVLLLLFAGLKFGKVALTGGTMLLSMVVYSFVFGWWYAVGFVLLILFHELGHYAAAKQRNLDVGAPTFIPFVGAWIQLKEQPMDVETEAYVGIAGPVAGTVAAMACYYAAEYAHSLASRPDLMAAPAINAESPTAATLSVVLSKSL